MRFEKLIKTFAYYMTLFSFGVVAASFGPALKTLSENTNVDLSQISYVFVANGFSFFLGSTFFGKLFDRFRGHPIIAISFIIMSSLTFFIPTITNFYMLLALFFVIGLFVGVIFVGGNTLLVWIHEKNVSPWMNGLHLFSGIGSFLIPIVFTYVLKHYHDITFAYRTMSIIYLVPGILLLFLKSPEIRKKDESEESTEINMFLLVIISIIFLLYVGCEAGFGAWIYTYSLELKNGSESISGYITATFWGSLAFGRLLAIIASKHISSKKILLINYIGSISTILVILTFSKQINIVWIGTFILGTFMASVFPTMLVYSEELIKVDGKINGIFFAAAGLGGMLLPMIIGQLIGKFGKVSSIYTVFLALFISLLLFIILNRSIKTKKAAIKAA